MSRAKALHDSDLHYIAVFMGGAEIAKCLLSHNADVNAKNKEGNTPLHALMDSTTEEEAQSAWSDWMKEMAELLLANKADLNAKNNEGQTPLMIAIKLKNKGAIELLRKHEAK